MLMHPSNVFRVISLFVFGQQTSCRDTSEALAESDCVRFYVNGMIDVAQKERHLSATTALDTVLQALLQEGGLEFRKLPKLSDFAVYSGLFFDVLTKIQDSDWNQESMLLMKDLVWAVFEDLTYFVHRQVMRCSSQSRMLLDVVNCDEFLQADLREEVLDRLPLGWGLLTDTIASDEPGEENTYLKQQIVGYIDLWHPRYRVGKRMAGDLSFKQVVHGRSHNFINIHDFRRRWHANCEWRICDFEEMGVLHEAFSFADLEKELSSAPDAPESRADLRASHVGKVLFPFLLGQVCVVLMWSALFLRTYRIFIPIHPMLPYRHLHS